jgi:hypothetical protein
MCHGKKYIFYSISQINKYSIDFFNILINIIKIKNGMLCYQWYIEYLSQVELK